MLNLNKCTKPRNLNQHSTCKNCSGVCVSLCTTVIHNTAQNSSDNFPSYLPGSHDDAYWTEGQRLFQDNLGKPAPERSNWSGFDEASVAHHSIFTGRMLFLTINQQFQSPESNLHQLQLTLNICKLRGVINDSDWSCNTSVISSVGKRVS